MSLLGSGGQFFPLLLIVNPTCTFFPLLFIHCYPTCIFFPLLLIVNPTCIFFPSSSLLTLHVQYTSNPLWVYCLVVGLSTISLTVKIIEKISVNPIVHCDLAYNSVNNCTRTHGHWSSQQIRMAKQQLYYL